MIFKKFELYKVFLYLIKENDKNRQNFIVNNAKTEIKVPNCQTVNNNKNVNLPFKNGNQDGWMDTLFAALFHFPFLGFH